jgi:hypothetical protein
MAEQLLIAEGSREAQYQALLPQVLALIDTESDIIAAMANCSAAIQQTFNWLWTGFYLVKGEQLVGPFQGPIACTRIESAAVRQRLGASTDTDRAGRILPRPHRLLVGGALRDRAAGVRCRRYGGGGAGHRCQRTGAVPPQQQVRQAVLLQ